MILNIEVAEVVEGVVTKLLRWTTWPSLIKSKSALEIFQQRVQVLFATADLVLLFGLVRQLVVFTMIKKTFDFTLSP